MTTRKTQSRHAQPAPGISPDDPVVAGVQAYFGEFDYPADGSRILVALSGGTDSVALLFALRAIAPEHAWQLGAAHVNYHLRGPESEEDEEFCRALSARLEIPFHCHHAHRPNDTNVNVQAWARSERYAFFERLMQSDGYARTAVAHTLDDRAESVAAAVIEARGTFALAGIPAYRDRIIRPFINLSRCELGDFLIRHSLDHREDSTNALTDYLRNRVRHEFLPHWADANPSITRGLARLSDQLQRQEQYLFRAADELLQEAMLTAGDDGIQLDAGRLRTADTALDPFLLRLLSRRADVTSSPTSDTVERFRELRLRRNAGRVEQGALVIELSKDVLSVYRRLSPAAPPPESVALTVGGEVTFGALRVSAHMGKAQPARRCDDRYEAMFDWNCLAGPLVLRRWQRGDRYRPIGLNGEKSLADVFADRGIPRHARAATPILIDSRGILWPIGHPIADRAKLTSATESVLNVKVSRS